MSGFVWCYGRTLILFQGPALAPTVHVRQIMLGTGSAFVAQQKQTLSSLSLSTTTACTDKYASLNTFLLLPNSSIYLCSYCSI
jgi:hypothetical protein